MINLSRVWTVSAMAFAAGLGCAPDAAPDPPGGGPSDVNAVIISRVTPASGPATGSTSVTITGTGFKPGATVTFDGVAGTVSSLSSTTIEAITPAHAAGGVEVVVTNPGGVAARLAVAYAYIPRPVVTSVSPTRGATGGGTDLTISGSGFQMWATVTLGGAPQAVTVVSSTTMWVTTDGHEEGVAALVVTNPDGQSESLSDAYTYVLPQSFDFNGAWEGSALAHPDARASTVPRHSDMTMEFAIGNNLVTSITCGNVALTLSPALAVISGGFSLGGGNGVVISGRIVSDGRAIGTINTGACPGTRWSAVRK